MNLITSVCTVLFRLSNYYSDVCDRVVTDLRTTLDNKHQSIRTTRQRIWTKLLCIKLGLSHAYSPQAISLINQTSVEWRLWVDTFTAIDTRRIVRSFVRSTSSPQPVTQGHCWLPKSSDTSIPRERFFNDTQKSVTGLNREPHRSVKGSDSVTISLFKSTSVRNPLLTSDDWCLHWKRTRYDRVVIYTVLVINSWELYVDET